MKYLLIIAIAVSFASCERCYTCNTAVNYSPNIPNMGSGTATSEFCGTRKKMEAHQRAGNTKTTAHSNGVTVTQTTTMTCQ